MKNIFGYASFKLNDDNLMDDWKKMSDKINENLKGVDGFIYRDSAVSEDGTVYCFLKWESKEKQEAFKKVLESDAFKGEMEAFAKIVNMESMRSEILQIV